MRRAMIIPIVLALSVGLAQFVTANLPPDQVAFELGPLDNPFERLKLLHDPQDLEEGVYVGDEFCISCHDNDIEVDRDVKHRQALRVPFGSNSLVAGRGVVADYDQNDIDDFMQGLDFNTISSVFDPFKPNAPILSYNATDDHYLMTIGELTVQVVITQGGTGDWKQRYLTRIPVSDTPTGWARDNYVSPVQYNEKTYGYVAYHPEHWWNLESGAPLLGPSPSVTDVAAVGRSYSKRCIGCHTTGTRELFQDENGEWAYLPYPAALVNPERAEQYPDYDHDGIPDIVNIGCEACHGPGSKHILGQGDPDEILAPSGLDTDASNALCQQCHVRVKSVPNQVHSWPYNDATGESWIPGVTEAPLESFYVDADGRWPDLRNGKQHHQQWHDFYESSKPGFEFHPVKCVECHDPHKGGRHMIRTSIEDEGLTIPTDNDNNTLCLACHATHEPFEDITKEQVAEYEENLDHIRNVTEDHTYHPYAPERNMGLSRCSKCHMPKIQKSAINYDIHGHTFEVIAPGKTLAFQPQGGMPNSCAVSCHSNMVNSFGLGCDPDIGTWDAQFDIDLANALAEYYGPGGRWWDAGFADALESHFALSQRGQTPVKFDNDDSLRPERMGRREEN